LPDVLPRDVKSGRERQVADELTLRSSVAFTEGMQRVQLTKVVGRTLAEGAARETGKGTRLGELFE
jgi:hypothetical protein